MSTEYSIEEEFLKKLNNLIELNLENENFSVGDLAVDMGMSRSQLHRKLNASTGKSTSQFIREYRLEKAMKMLQGNVATSSEIAYRVGFGSPSYFNTCFHEFYGYPPGEVKFRNPLKNVDIEVVQPLNENFGTVTIKRSLYDFRFYITGVLSLVLIVIFAYYNFSKSETTISSETIKPVILDDKSIAVLPFKNISGDPANEAFCDGMTLAIISRLSKIRDINKVISQTSMMSYKDSQKTMAVIAEELKVHYILESGFQKSGNNIKINIQLIDGTSDKLIWSEEYEEKYDSIFKIQARVAEIVAEQLNAKITKEERVGIHKPSTKNMEAYDNVLQGFFLFKSNSTNKIIASRKYFEKAIALDTTYVDAYVLLGRTFFNLGTRIGNLSRKEADSLAVPYFKKAIQLDPKNYQLIYVMTERELFNWNFIKADSLNKINVQQRGENFNTIFIDLVLSRYDEIIKSSNFLLKEGPKAASGWKGVAAAYAYYFKGKKDSSLYIMSKGLQYESDIQYGSSLESLHDHFGNIYLAFGDYKKAQQVFETGLQTSEKRHASMVIHLAAVYYYLGDERKSKELLNEVIVRANKGEPEINVFVAHYYARIGNHNEAFKWLDIAYKKHEVDLIWLHTDPNLALLKSDSRYKVLSKKIGFLDLK